MPELITDRERELWRLNLQVHRARYPENATALDSEISQCRDYVYSLDACTPLIDEMIGGPRGIALWKQGDCYGVTLMEDYSSGYVARAVVHDAGSHAEAIALLYLKAKKQSNA